MAYHIRPLKTLEDCQQVVELEKHVWGYSDGDDVVPSSILLVSIKRGGILLGAFDPDDPVRMIGFVYSLAGIKDGQPTQWSHMLGVLPHVRDGGIGAELKRRQREAALAMGITVIEWTYDPLQALNAHLNFAKLGAIAEEYVENIYGDSSSPLHRGTPTDRLIALWKLDAPHVVRRLDATALRMRESGTFDATPVLEVGADFRPSDVTPDVHERRVAVEIPTGFSEMQLVNAPLALAWRMASRRAFTTYFGRGYRALDFFLDRERGRGRYLLARE